MLYNYELALILSAKLTDEKQKKMLDEVKKYISATGSKVDEAKLFGKKTFAYPLKSEKEGYYYIITYSLDGKESAPLTKKMNLNEGILRYLIVRR